MHRADFDHPYFLPLWRRVVVVTICLGWAVLELNRGALWWALLFAGAGLYASYGFYCAARKRTRENNPNRDTTGTDADGH